MVQVRNHIFLMARTRNSLHVPDDRMIVNMMMISRGKLQLNVGSELRGNSGIIHILLTVPKVQERGGIAQFIKCLGYGLGRRFPKRAKIFSTNASRPDLGRGPSLRTGDSFTRG
jgi:hypothetical protein